MSTAKGGCTILLAQEDSEVRSFLETVLGYQGYSVQVAPNGGEALACLQHDPDFSAVLIGITDLRDADNAHRDGIFTLQQIRRRYQDLPVIVISDMPVPGMAAEAIRNGASDFISTPLQPEDLLKALQTALEPKPADAAAAGQMFFGNSTQMRRLQGMLAQVAASDAPVLIQGETGSGKEVFARELHRLSPRSKRPMLKLNCAALPSELVESELFGYERGAFTGAFQRKQGMFEVADGGTILLDEIGDMDYKLQAKLLQVLQDHEFHRLGGKETVRVDIRVIAATHRDLEKAIAQETFREDLYYRINVISIHLPPLRDRKEDVIPIAENLVRKHNPQGAQYPVIPYELRQVFLDYHWPGNIRELENVIRKFLVLRDSDAIAKGLRVHSHFSGDVSSHAVPDHLVRTAEPPPASNCPHHELANGEEPILKQVARAKMDAERAAILSALNATNWNRRQAAVQLKIDYKALLYKMKKLAIRKERAASCGG